MKIIFAQIIAKVHIAERWGLIMLRRFANIAAKLLWRTNIPRSNIAKSAEIVRIEEDGYADVYNMEVSGTHCFSVNGGIIVHNCMDAMRYFVMTKKIMKRV